MTFVPTSDFLWDFWFAPRHEGDDGLYHLFHLKAPRIPRDPEGRHWQARIGHAVSRDLESWEERGTVFVPGPDGAWDDLAIWTGSILWHDGQYWFFYTAIDQRTRGRIQRMGIATSPDLTTWTRHPGNPILTADPRWYMTYDSTPLLDEPFRDPMVIRDEAAGVWRMFFCAKSAEGPLDERGVVGMAISEDLIHWESRPPICGPGEFGELEVPMTVRVGDRWYLVFCTQHHSNARLHRTGDAGKWYGTHYLVSDKLTGPYRLTTDAPLLGDKAGSWYAGRIETQLTGEPIFFAWRRLADDGSFVGGLSNPVQVTVDGAGNLSIDESQLW